jgi:hypothetical protein
MHPHALHNTRTQFSAVYICSWVSAYDLIARGASLVWTETDMLPAISCVYVRNFVQYICSWFSTICSVPLLSTETDRLDTNNYYSHVQQHICKYMHIHIHNIYAYIHVYTCTRTITLYVNTCIYIHIHTRVYMHAIFLFMIQYGLHRTGCMNWGRFGANSCGHTYPNLPSVMAAFSTAKSR